MHALRVLFCVLALLWLLPLMGEVESLFGLSGWFDLQVYTDAGTLNPSPYDGRNWSLLWLVAGNPAALQGFYWGSITILGLYLVGLWPRLLGVLSWLVVISFSSIPMIETDTDVFLRMMAFYLMVGYLFLGLGNDPGTWLARFVIPKNYFLLGRGGNYQATTSSAATVAIRLLQVHFAFAMVMTGLHKLQMAEWWSGIALWYVLNPAAQTSIESLQNMIPKRDSYFISVSLAAYALLAWQIAFPTFAWRSGRCRWILLGGGLVGLFGLVLVYQIPVLGPTFLVCCLAYWKDEEWNRVLNPLRRMVGRPEPVR